MHCFRIYGGGALLSCLLALTACAPAAAPQAKIHTMGERVTAGSLVYNVFDTQWKTQLGEGNDARIPKDRFFLIRLNVVNGGTAEIMVPTITLVDDSGQSYTELPDGDKVPNWIGFLRHVKPAESLMGNILFDVPQKHFHLRVSDENSQKTEDIDIPLSFSTEQPDIPAPAQ